VLEKGTAFLKEFRVGIYYIGAPAKRILQSAKLVRITLTAHNNNKCLAISTHQPALNTAFQAKTAAKSGPGLTHQWSCCSCPSIHHLVEPSLRLTCLPRCRTVPDCVLQSHLSSNTVNARARFFPEYGDPQFRFNSILFLLFSFNYLLSLTMSSPRDDRYYGSLGKSRRSTPAGDTQGVFFQTGQGGRTVLPPLSSAFPTSRFPGLFFYVVFKPSTHPIC
jgi:hypothetical protein